MLSGVANPLLRPTTTGAVAYRYRRCPKPYFRSAAVPKAKHLLMPPHPPSATWASARRARRVRGPTPTRAAQLERAAANAVEKTALNGQLLRQLGLEVVVHRVQLGTQRPPAHICDFLQRVPASCIHCGMHFLGDEPPMYSESTPGNALSKALRTAGAKAVYIPL